MNPLVSVIIPAYNPSPAIREAIDSALGQSYRPVEVIVVDDGSTVDAAWLPQVYGERITFLRQPNGGPASARNTGIRRARGAYIAFLDADDVWEPDKLSAQIELLERRPSVGLAYAAVTRIDSVGRPRPDAWVRRGGPSGWVFDALFMKNHVPTSTVVVRRACLEQTGLFDEARELVSVEDYDLWLRIAERFEIACITRPLSRYRLHEAGISRNTARSYHGERLVIERAVARNPRRPVVRRRLRQRHAQLSFECGHEHFSANRLVDARQQFRESLHWRPWQPRALAFYAATFLGARGVDTVRGVKRSTPPHPQDRIRLLHVLFSLDTGGAEYVVLNLLKRLDPARYDLHVCSLTGAGQLTGEFRALGVEVHVLHKRAGIDVGLIGSLVRLLRRTRADIVHTHNVTPWLYAGIAARIIGTTLYHTEHSNLFPHQRALMAAERWLARWTRLVISDSEKVKRQLVEGQGLPAQKIVTVLNGIDTAAFAAAAGTAGAASAAHQRKRRELGLDGAAPLVGTVGRLAAVKDQATLLEAFAQVATRFPHARLLMIGDGPMRPSLEARAKALGIAPRVLFLGRRTDIAELLPLLDVFVLSSVSEGLPLTVLEAMACGVPVVATDVGGLREVVSDGQTGLLVPVKSPERLAQAVATLLGDAAGRRTMGETARRRAATQFDVSHMVRGYEAAYHHQLVS